MEQWLPSHKGEEPGVCGMEQIEFEWACTWLGDGGMPALVEDKAQGLLSQVSFCLPRLTPFLFDFSILFSPSCL